MPIYIAQKDIAGGLHWDQSIKGLIYFWWAIVQNLSPLLAGGLADKYGFKKIMPFSFLFVIIGYIMIATQREFYPFLFGTLFIGLGAGFFKPALQGALARSMNNENSSTGWGTYFALMNAAVFLAPLLGIALKEISWQAVFVGSGIVFSLNIVLLYFFKDDVQTKQMNFNVAKEILKTTLRPQILWIVVIMSGFIMLYMQFYETLPNFIYDWSDTSGIVKSLSLSDFWIYGTPRGDMIKYELLYNLNSGFTIIAIVFVSWLFSRVNKIIAMMLGVLIAVSGILVLGFSMTGYMLILGILIYTLGEMIVNPKFNDFVSHIAPDNRKSLYLGFINIPRAVGLSLGGLIGGYIYEHYGEKSGLAIKYIQEHYSDVEIGKHSEAMNLLANITGKSHQELTTLLWNEYEPFTVWIPFAAIGLITIVSLIAYKKKYS